MKCTGLQQLRIYISTDDHWFAKHWRISKFKNYISNKQSFCKKKQPKNTTWKKTIKPTLCFSFEKSAKKGKYNQDACTVNTFASDQNREFSCQSNRIAHGFAREFIWSGQRYRPGERLKRRGSLLVCTRKNFLLGGCGFFVSYVISERLLGQLSLLYLALGTNR